MISIPGRKHTRDSPITVLVADDHVAVTVTDLIPTVRPGEHVHSGQVVARAAEGARWARVVHSPITGTVRSTSGRTVIEGTVVEPACVPDPVGDVILAAKNAGLVGMGGAMFPTYAKLAAAKGRIETVIVNGCQSEPYVTCDHRVLREHGDALQDSLQILTKQLGARQGIVVDRAATYPDGYERFLVERVQGRRLPRHALPIDVGALVLNVQTLWALHRALVQRRPLVDRVITVDGAAVGRPGNYVVPIGTRIGHVLQACDADLSRAKVLLGGGPMMGRRVTTDDPVTAGMIAVLALDASEVNFRAQEACIRCGRCMQACPLDLPAGLLADAPKPDRAVFDCIECGLCAYACPAGRPLVSLLRQIKMRLGEESDL